jgi:hypothetical protein
MTTWYDPTLNLSAAVTWSIVAGAIQSPVISWGHPGRTADHIKVFRGSTGVWADAALVTTLAGSAFTYTDAAASADGSEFYWWVIAYSDPDETFSGRLYGMLGCANSYANVSIVLAATSNTDGQTVTDTVTFTDKLNTPASSAFYSISMQGSATATSSPDFSFNPGANWIAGPDNLTGNEFMMVHKGIQLADGSLHAFTQSGLVALGPSSPLQDVWTDSPGVASNQWPLKIFFNYGNSVSVDGWTYGGSAAFYAQFTYAEQSGESASAASGGVGGSTTPVPLAPGQVITVPVGPGGTGPVPQLIDPYGTPVPCYRIEIISVDGATATGSILSSGTLTSLGDGPTGAEFVLPQGSWGVYTPVSEITGLDYLAGKSVMTVLDGLPEGPFVVPPDGTLALPFPTSSWLAGLSYSCQLQTLRLELEGVPTQQGRRKLLPAVSVILDNTQGLKAGDDFAHVCPIPDFDSPDSGSPCPPLFSGIKRVLTGGGWDLYGQVALQQDWPLPATILGVVVEAVLGDDDA